MHTLKRHTKKVLVGIVGGTVVLIGVVLIPYPGPGWLIVFAGLAILSTEFVWAQRALGYARERYDRWVLWLQRQPVGIRLLVLAFTGIVVVVTVWLVNGYGLISSWFHLNWDLLRSPFFK